MKWKSPKNEKPDDAYDILMAYKESYSKPCYELKFGYYMKNTGNPEDDYIGWYDCNDRKLPTPIWWAKPEEPEWVD